MGKRRLIDANALIATLEKIAKEDETPYFHLDEITQEIFDAPTVDAVPVVRCKDCKHFVSPQGVPVCGCFYGLGFPSLSGDDFCSCGERRTNERKAD